MILKLMRRSSLLSKVNSGFREVKKVNYWNTYDENGLLIEHQKYPRHYFEKGKYRAFGGNYFEELLKLIETEEEKRE